MHEKGNTAANAETSGFIRDDFSSIYCVPTGFAHQLETSGQVRGSDGKRGENQLLGHLLLEAGP